MPLKRTRSNANDAVLRKWGKTDYKKIKSDNSVPSQDKAKPEVIEIFSSEDETDIEVTTESSEKNNDEWCFKLFKSDVYDGGLKSPHFITLKEILGSPELKESVLFSFQYNLDYLLSQFNSNRIDLITIVAQQGTIQPLDGGANSHLLPLLNRLKIIEFPMPPYTCHHSKMIINYYRDGSCRLFMPSANFTYAEETYPQQVCWVSPVISVGTVCKEDVFKRELIRYLKNYQNNKVTRLIENLEKYDFTSLSDVTLIFSTPGKMSSDVGLIQLTRHIPKPSINGPYHFACITSSIGGSISRGSEKSNLFTNIMIPEFMNFPTKKRYKTSELKDLFEKHNVNTYLVFPTTEEIERKCPMGEYSSGWFHFQRDKDPAYYNLLKNEFKVFYKQGFMSNQRGATPCHTKYYIASTDPSFKAIDWCCYTSANLSYSAWGTMTAKPRNYEIGLLFKSNPTKTLNCTNFINLIYKRNGTTMPIAHQSIITPVALDRITPFSSLEQAFTLDPNIG